MDETSQHSVVDHTDASCGPEGPEKTSTGNISDDLKVVDLRLKSENMSLDAQAQVTAS